MVDLLVTYMEMTAAASGPSMPPPIAGSCAKRAVLTTTDYLGLYRAVGAPLQWDQRLRMSLPALEDFLNHPQTCLFVLRLDGRLAGFCEFDGIGRPDVELTHFGLVPSVQGRKLGPYLLDRGLRAAWAAAPNRIWLHTDTNDHPKAQDTYRKAGFEVFARRVETFPD